MQHLLLCPPMWPKQLSMCVESSSQTQCILEDLKNVKWLLAHIQTNNVWYVLLPVELVTAAVSVTDVTKRLPADS